MKPTDVVIGRKYVVPEASLPKDYMNHVLWCTGMHKMFGIEMECKDKMVAGWGHSVWLVPEDRSGGLIAFWWPTEWVQPAFQIGGTITGRFDTSNKAKLDSIESSQKECKCDLWKGCTCGAIDPYRQEWK